MANAYKIMKDKHRDELNKFPIVFAFSEEQLREAVEKLGYSYEKRDYVGNIVSVGGGGFIRKSDSEEFHNIFEKHENEFADAVEADSTGEGFIYDMFYYELANHEYGYTGETTDALISLGLTLKDVKEDVRLMKGLAMACDKIDRSDV